MFSAAQLRMLLRAIVNLDPYTFADDLAEDIAEENDKRSAEKVLLATIDATSDDKLTRFALRLALSGHVGIPRENEQDFLAEAETAFLSATPKKSSSTKRKKPAIVRPTNSAAKKAKARNKAPHAGVNAVVA